MQNRLTQISMLIFLSISVGMGCKGADYNKFTVDDIPLLVRVYVNDGYSYTPNSVRAEHELGKLTSTEEGLDAVLDLLKSDDPDVRAEAAFTLTSVCTNSIITSDKFDEFFNILVEHMQDEDESVRYYLISGFSQIFKLPPDTLEDSTTERSLLILLDSIADPYNGVRRRAAWGLREPGQYADQVIESLEETLDHDDVNVRVSAAYALSLQEAKSDKAVMVLIDAVNNHEIKSAGTAIDALGEFGPAAEEGLDFLVELLESERRHLAGEALQAIELIGPGDGSVIDSLIDLLDSDDHYVRFLAVRTLSLLAPDSSRVLPYLREMLNNQADQSEETRRELRNGISYIEATMDQP